MAAKEDIQFGEVLLQLLRERYRNRRKDFASSIHVSESALSQYVRGKATPSLHVLVAIARELNVSLDYLVFGVERDSPAPDVGGLAALVEEAIARSQVRTATLRDFVGRVGSALGQQIEATATRLIEEQESVLGSGLTWTEVLHVEGISKRVRIATVDLDVLLLSEGRAEDGDGEHGDIPPSPFGPVISANIQRGCDYSYVIPEGSEWRRKARKLREAVSSSQLMTGAAVDRRLRFFESGRGLFPGYVIYEIDQGQALVGDRLLDQIADFVSDSGMVALAEPSSQRSRFYSMIDVAYHKRLLADYDAMTHGCPRLVFD